MPRITSNFTSIKQLKHLIMDRVQTTIREEEEIETVNEKGQRILRRKLTYYTQPEYDPPYIVDTIVSTKDYPNVMTYLTNLHIVYDVGVSRVFKGRGFRVRIKYRHPDYYTKTEDLTLKEDDVHEEISEEYN
jgi:hypothetical protein